LIEVKEGEQEHLIRQKLKESILGIDQNLQHIIPPYQELLSLKVDDEKFATLAPKQKREKTFEAIRDLLIRGTQDRPILLVFEDLHWIDKTTEEFLNYMIGWLPRTRILLLLLYRPEYTHQWGSKSYYSMIGVGQLSTSTSAELVAAILEGGDVVPELRELILNRAAGNPLFIEELTRSLLQNGSIQKKDNRFVLTRDVPSHQVPDTIQGIIAARMDRLEESLKRIMQVAAVIGREFAFRILETITEMKEELKSGLINLQGLEFIYEKSLFPDLEYIFRHALVQEVAYNSLLVNRRKEIHEQIGKAIEELYPKRMEEFYEILAYHYARGEHLEKASQYLKLSGKKAARNHSLWEAYSFYKEALATLSRLPENVDNKKEKLEVLVLMLTPMIPLTYPEGSLGMLQEGERLSKELGDNRRLALFRSRVGHYYTYRGKHLLALNYSEDAFEETRKSQDVDLITPLAWGLCASYLGTGQYEKILDIAPGVLDLLEKTEKEFDFFALSVNPYSHLCGYCGMSMGYLGNFEQGKIFLEKGLRHATQIGDLRTLGNVEWFWGMFLHNKGEWKPAIEHFQNCIKNCDEVKYLAPLAWAWALLGNISSSLGEPDTASRYVEKGLKIQREAGFEWFLSFYPYFLGDICLQRGDLKKARSFMDEALKLSQKNNEKWMEGFSWIGLGRILWRVETPQIDTAEEHILRGMKILDDLKLKPSRARGHLVLGELYAESGRREEALENLKKAESMFQDMGMDYWLGKAQKALAHF
jgi:tetratricopeptide (TPR) repeat protein